MVMTHMGPMVFGGERDQSLCDPHLYLLDCGQDLGLVRGARSVVGPPNNRKATRFAPGSDGDGRRRQERFPPYPSGPARWEWRQVRGRPPGRLRDASSRKSTPSRAGRHGGRLTRIRDFETAAPASPETGPQLTAAAAAAAAAAAGRRRCRRRRSRAGTCGGAATPLRSCRRPPAPGPGWSSSADSLVLVSLSLSHIIYIYIYCTLSIMLHT